MATKRAYFWVFLTLMLYSWVNFLLPLSSSWWNDVDVFIHLLDNGTLPLPLKEVYSYQEQCLIKRQFADADLIRKFKVVPNGSDIITMLRIQKTGSRKMTSHLTRHIDVSRWCKCNRTMLDSCFCFKKWISYVMFLRSPDAFPCGLHADWTVLHECAERHINERRGRKIKQRHLYMTMLRDPTSRFVSEWKNVQRGATWDWAPLKCNGKIATRSEIPPCYTTKNWTYATLHDFMNCSSNLAINRQTRMLADLRLVNCYNTSGMSYDERHFQMLESAKENLKNMAFFGLTEYQELSQILFENTFNLKFISGFHTTPLDHTQSGHAHASEDDRQKIAIMNRFDVMLYQFAKDLFFQRLKMLAETKSRILYRRRLKALLTPLMSQYSRSPCFELSFI